MGPCEFCILGKHKKLPYTISKAVSHRPLNYVYGNLWGPARTKSLGVLVIS